MSPRPVSPQPGSATNLVGTCHDAIDTDQAEKGTPSLMSDRDNVMTPA